MLQIVLKFIYNWNAVVVAIIGVVLDLVIYFSTASKTSSIKKPWGKRSIGVYISVVVIALLTVFLVGIVTYLNNYYTIVPESVEGNKPLRTVQEILVNNDLDYATEMSTGAIAFTEEANKKLSEGVALTNDYFIVIKTNPPSGTFLRKYTVIELTVAWADEISTFADIPTEGKEANDEIQE